MILVSSSGLLNTSKEVLKFASRQFLGLASARLLILQQHDFRSFKNGTSIEFYNLHLKVQNFKNSFNDALKLHYQHFQFYSTITSRKL